MGNKLSSEVRSVRNRLTRRHPREASIVELMETIPSQPAPEPIPEPIQDPKPDLSTVPLRTYYHCPNKAMKAPLPPRSTDWPSVLFEPQVPILLEAARIAALPFDFSSCSSSPLTPREIRAREERTAAYNERLEAARREAEAQESAQSESPPNPPQEIPAPPQEPSPSLPEPPQEVVAPASLLDIESKGKPNGFNRAAKLALRTERHMQRHFSFHEVLAQTRLRLLRMFRRKPRRRHIKKGGCFARFRNWRRSAMPPRPHSPPLPSPRPESPPLPPPEFPILETCGITMEQTLRLSETIHVVTQPPNTLERDFSGPKTTTIPFIMVHQTNEFEIMSTVGSFRLNPQLWAKKDTEGLGYVEEFPYLEELIFEFNTFERTRRRIAYERVHKSLTLQEAYDIGHGKKIERFGIAEFARMKGTEPGCPVNMYPVVHSEEPVIGVPFKMYFKDVVDIPEYSIDMFCYINKYLDLFGVQVIDLRCRYEEILGQKPWIMDESNMILDVTNAVIRSMPTLESISATAKYFVVHAFFTNNVPFHSLQMIVRYKPELSENSLDWVNDGVTRLQIEEDDPLTIHPFPTRTV